MRWHVRKRYVAFAAIAAIAAISGALTRAGAAGPPLEVSSSGVPIPPDMLIASDARELARLHAASQLSQIRAVGGRTFSRFATDDFGTCFAVGYGAERLGAVMCDVTFPSTVQPILDASVLVKNDVTPTTQLVALQGFAADIVSRVGVTTPSGEVAVPVVNNTYYLGEAPTSASELVAHDHEGNVLYRQPLQSGG